jgi:hypothetical protein
VDHQVAGGGSPDQEGTLADPAGGEAERQRKEHGCGLPRLSELEEVDLALGRRSPVHPCKGPAYLCKYSRKTVK